MPYLKVRLAERERDRILRASHDEVYKGGASAGSTAPDGVVVADLYDSQTLRETEEKVERCVILDRVVQTPECTSPTCQRQYY